MAKINFYFRGKNEVGNLTIKLKHSTSIDYRISSDIVSKRTYWIKTNKSHRKLEELSYLGEDAKSHKKFLEEIKESLLLRFNNDFNTGVPITSKWLTKNIKEVTSILSSKEEIINVQTEINNRKQEQLNIELDRHTKNLVTSAIIRVAEIEYFNNINQSKIYKQLLNKINAYQEAKKVELKTKDITQNFIDEFTSFLIKDLQHQNSTAHKHCKSLVHSVKYQKNAFPEIVEVSLGIREITYKKQSKSERKSIRDEIVVTLSFDELDQIHNTDVPEKLLNAKKVILFGCEVGLRVSDYCKLTIENIKKVNDVEYWGFWNKKTGINVVIPITQRIKKYIDCYGMPKTEYSKTADVIINREIKQVCELAGINEEIQSRKSQSVTLNGEIVRRSIPMKYPKYQVISTHSLRRSFATNYYNILTPFQIRQITGHTSDAQLMEYINQDKDRTEIIEQMMNKMNAIKNNTKPQLKIAK